MPTTNTPPPEPPPEEDSPNAELVQAIETDERPKDPFRPMLATMVPQFEMGLKGRDGTPLIDPQKFARIALTAIRKNPLLQQATQASLLGSIMACAQLGLEPHGPLGHAYLVPFRHNNEVEVQLIIGYQGMIQLALRSGMVASISAQVVREGDLFSYEYGTNEHLTHRPGKEKGEITHAWALAKLVTGGAPFVVLDIDQVEEARNRSKSGAGPKPKGPWATDYEAMARKTAVRRLFKWLPSSVEVRGALGADSGVVHQIPESIEDFDDVIEVEGEEI